MSICILWQSIDFRESMNALLSEELLGLDSIIFSYQLLFGRIIHKYKLGKNLTISALIRHVNFLLGKRKKSLIITILLLILSFIVMTIMLLNTIFFEES